jgi:RsiW-degrading membrane proteinase PrsW (M82 family)/Flp pilus assembly protein TadD
LSTLKWFGLYLLLPSAILVLLATYSFQDPGESDPQKRIAHALASGNHFMAKAEYRKLIEQDFGNVKWHRGYISAHLEQPKYQGGSRRRDDRPILEEYERHAQSTDASVADIGWYGLGYLHSVEGDYPLALESFNRVRDRSLPYLNNSVGYAQQSLGAPDLAEASFRREIEIGGHVDGARSNLARLMYDQGRFAEIEEMASDPGVRQVLDRYIVRYLDLRERRFLRYAVDAIGARRATASGALGAALVFLVWFVYLRQVDVFERERARHAGMMTVVAMGFSLCTVPLYDLLRFGLGFTLTGRPAGDLLFCILGIGLVEETVKIVPVLLIMRLTSVVNESTDYLIYGSLSGLGFAFVENLLYFDDSGLKTIAARAISATVLHMTLTAMVMYGLLYARYSARRQPVLYTLLAFAGACVVHGVYDFWLVTGGWLGQLKAMSVLILLVAITRYGRALNTAMNLSEHMPPRHDPLLNLTRWLCGSLAAIIMLQYLLLAAKYGAANANRNLASTVFSSFLLIFVILGSLARFTITKGKWIDLFARRGE